MADPTYVGTLEPLQQGTSYSFDRQRGGTYVEHWRGLSVDQLRAKLAAAAETCQRANLEDRFGIGDLRLEWASSSDGSIGSPTSLDVTFDRWEISEPDELQDVLNHPTFVYNMWLSAGFNDSNTADLISIVRRAAERAKSSDDSAEITEADCVAKMTAYLTSIGSSLVPSDDWKYYYRLYANNQTHYHAATYSLRHTTNAPGYWARNVADANVNRILTHAQFLSEIGDTSSWRNPCPGRLAYKLTAAYDARVAELYTRTNYIIGWLKSPSPETDVGRGRIEIQTTYRLDQWPIALYPLAT